MSYIKKNLSLVIGYGVLFVGLFSVIIGLLIRENLTWIDAGIVSFSWGIAVLAFKISSDSAKNSKAQSNVQFLQVINMVEDARTYFIGGRYKPDLFGWKTHSFIRMAVELLKRDEKKECIEPDFQDLLFHYFNISFIHLFKFPDWEKEKISVDTGINNFTKAYAMLEDYYNSQRKKEFKKFIKEEPKINFEEFYKRVEEVKKTKNYGIV
jgi:hypothetical protein